MNAYDELKEKLRAREDWLRSNPDKRDSVEFQKVLKNYKDLKETGKTIDLGFFGNVQEAITGTGRRTQTVASLPEWSSMPEMNEFSLESFLAAFGSTASGPKEIVEVVQEQFPSVTARQDSLGNFILKSKDGEEYAIPPGFTIGDIPRAIATLGMYTFGGIGKTVLGNVLRAMGVESVIQGSQRATGGRFDVSDVAMAGAFSPVADTFAKIFGGAVKAFKKPPQTLELTEDEVIEILIKATQGQPSQIKTLAEEAAPSQELIDAANRLGIINFLQPDHLSSNLVFKELMQGIKSFPGSSAKRDEKEGFELLGKKIENLLSLQRGIGETSDAVASQLFKVQKELDELVDSNYAFIRENVNEALPINATNLLNYIKGRLVNPNGERIRSVKDLSDMERKILSALSPRKRKLNDGTEVTELPTYGILDDLRRDVGDGLKNSGKPAFKDANVGLKKKMYELLSKDQVENLNAVDPSLANKLLEAQSQVKLRKAIEDDLISLFGKDTAIGINRLLKLQGPGGALNKVAKGDISELQKILNRVPENLKKDVMETALSVVLNPKQKADMIVDFNNFTNFYKSLSLNPKAKKFFLDNLPQGTNKVLDDLFKISNSISASIKGKIPTGRITTVEKDLKNKDALVGQFMQNFINNVPLVGYLISPTTSVLGSIYQTIKGKTNLKETGVKDSITGLLKSNSFSNALSKIGTREEVEALRQLRNSNPFRRFIEQTKISASEQDELFNFRGVGLSPREVTGGAVQTGRTFGEAVTPEKEERELPPAPPTRLRGSTSSLSKPKPNQSARNMLRRLFPMDSTIS
jgi:hypothetical protein